MFYDRLKDLCKINNTSVTVVTKKLGFSTGSMSQWKKGSCPSGNVVLRFAEYFNVSTDYLLGKTDDPTPPMVQRFENLEDFLGKNGITEKEDVEYLRQIMGLMAMRKRNEEYSDEILEKKG